MEIGTPLLLMDTNGLYIWIVNAPPESSCFLQISKSGGMAITLRKDAQIIDSQFEGIPVVVFQLEFPFYREFGWIVGVDNRKFTGLIC